MHGDRPFRFYYLRRGETTEGTKGAELLAQAVSAFRSTLEVYTREQLPQDLGCDPEQPSLSRSGTRRLGTWGLIPHCPRGWGRGLDPAADSLRASVRSRAGLADVTS